MHRWASFMAIGDSFTEGLEDGDGDGNYIGWADRLAAMMAAERPELRYANLAIRGNEMDDVEREQLPEVLATRPDLVSLCAGGNDLILPGADVDALAERFEDMARKIREAGCDLLIFTGQDTKMMPVMSIVRSKVAIYNSNLRAIADRHGCYVVDLWGMRSLRDRRNWAVDRLHLSSSGHQLVAVKAAQVLGVAIDPRVRAEATWEPAPAPAWVAARRSDLSWARDFLLPWIKRRMRGESMGDGLLPKRPKLVPFTQSRPATRQRKAPQGQPTPESHTV